MNKNTRWGAAAMAGIALTSLPAYADWNLQMRNLNDPSNGSDSGIDNYAEAITIINYGPSDGTYTYMDYTDVRTRIDVGGGSGNNFSGTDTLPNGQGNADQYVLKATAFVEIPAGTWTIGFGRDDGGHLKIDPTGADGFPGFTNEYSTSGDPTAGDNEIRREGFGGHQWTWGTFTLAAPLTTTIECIMYEAGGGDSLEIGIASGAQGSFSDSTWNRLVDGQDGWVVSDTVLEDTEPPVLVLPTDPADDATGVYPGATTLTATFDEDIALKAGGTITLTDTDDGSGNRAITLPNAGVSVSANVLTIDLSALDGGLPTGNLEFGTNYEVTIGGANNVGTDAIEDTWTPTANIYGGTNVGDWNFQTAAQNLIAPVLAVSPFVPADDATLVVPSSDISVTFDQDVVIGSGNIEIIDTGDASGNQTIAVTDSSQVSVSGATLTLSLTTPLEGTETYAIQIAAGAVKNYSDVNFAGILAPDVTTWNFETGGGRNLTWDPSGGGSSDGGGTWLDAGKWWDGSSNVNWENAFPDNATIGNGGGGGTITMGAVGAGTVLIDNFTGQYTFSGGSITQSGGVTIGPNSGNKVQFSSGAVLSGTGGLTVDGGYLDLDSGDNVLHDYSGPTVITNGGRLEFERNLSNPAPNTNIQINGGILGRYYQGTIRNTLGTGPGQLQILGGESGFQMNASASIQLNNDPNSQIQWGSAFFQPSVLILASDNTNGATRFQNPLDLNGADRTVNVPNDPQDNNGYSSFERVVSNSDGGNAAGLIKTGPGTLLLKADHTYDGGTTVNEGAVEYEKASAMPSTGTHTFNTGTQLRVRVGGGDDFTMAASGAGSLGGLLTGTGTGGSTTAFNGDIEVFLRGSGNYLGDLPNVGGGTTLFSFRDGNMTLSGTNSAGANGTIHVGRIGGGSRTLTLGSNTALQGSAVRVDTSGESFLDLNGFDAAVGKLTLGSNSGWGSGIVKDDVGGGTLTLTDGVFVEDHNGGSGQITVDTLDLNGVEQVFEVRDSGGVSLPVTSVIQNGSLTLSGLETNAKMRLEGVNTYTGETKVTGGILETTGTTCLADATEVRLEGSAKINLDYVGTDTIAELYLGGVAQGPGVYDNSTDPGYITGTGSLTVAAVGGSPFDTWASRDGALGVSFDGDANGDGVQDGLAFLLGADNPNVNATGLLPSAGENAGDLVMSFSCLAGSARGTSVLNLDWDGDLAAPWSSVVVPGVTGTPNDSDGTGTVNFTITDGGLNGEGDPLLNVVASIDDDSEATDGRLFGRVNGTE